MSNNIGLRSLNGDIHDDVTAADLQMKITVYYAGRVSKTSNTYEWKPLPHVDNTTREGKTSSSLNVQDIYPLKHLMIGVKLKVVIYLGLILLVYQ